jgi:hypothetical protein
LPKLTAYLFSGTALSKLLCNDVSNTKAIIVAPQRQIGGVDPSISGRYAAKRVFSE